MTSEETLKERLEELAQAISPDEKLIENVMSRINATPIASPSIGPAQNIWRTIMKNPITKLAAAAVIIIACSTGIILWRSTASGIALADVLTRIEHVTAYMYQMHSTRTRQQTTRERINTLLISQENGIKMISKTTDPNNGDVLDSETYLLPKKKSIIFIDHKEKTYVPMKYDERQLDFYKEEHNDPHTIIKQILGCDHISLGQSVMEGITVEGFQTTDLAYEGGFFGDDDYFVGSYEKVDVKLWVDVKTFLPIRLEEDIVTEKETHIHQISYDFRWNVVINAADFEPNIPDDYNSSIGDVIVPANNEENAVKGLRLYDDLVGKYPVSLDMKMMDEAFKEEVSKLIGWDDSYKGLSEDEKTKITSKWMTLGAPLLFYEELVDDNKDPAYYGETVRPDDTNKVLLRWKLDDGQYHVIFGDLHADTVTADVMKELETALP
jgi:outer membrane lipoprotein-sorting protein